MTEERFERALSLLTGVLDYERFKDVDLVIEVNCNIPFIFLPMLTNFSISYFELSLYLIL